MDYVELIKRRQMLKRELMVLRENRKPEDIIKVTRDRLVIQGTGYAVARVEIETTEAELKIESEINRLKLLAYGKSGALGNCA